MAELTALQRVLRSEVRGVIAELDRIAADSTGDAALLQGESLVQLRKGQAAEVLVARERAAAKSRRRFRGDELWLDCLRILSRRNNTQRNSLYVMGGSCVRT